MREIVFDTETTGLNPAGGDRMVEIGCIEMINRVATGRTFHCYFNPDRDMPPAAEAVRTARVQLQSRAIGEHIYHPAGAHAQVRNAIMRAKTSEDYYGHLAWLYGGTGLEGAGPAA